jgi:signal recognition particle subunit SRP54
VPEGVTFDLTEQLHANHLKPFKPVVCLQEDEVLAFQKRLEADAFDFNDFLQQFKSVNNMGGLQMLKLMPGFSGVSEKQLYEVEKKLKKYEGMITSMTEEVRKDCCLFAA